MFLISKITQIEELMQKLLTEIDRTIVPVYTTDNSVVAFFRVLSDTGSILTCQRDGRKKVKQHKKWFWKNRNKSNEISVAAMKEKRLAS